MNKKSKQKIALGSMVLALVFVLVLVGAGCSFKASNSPTESIRPANEATEDEGGAVAVTTTPAVTKTDTACRLTKPSYGSSNALHQALLKYFDAIDHKNYDVAFAMLADDALARYASQGGSTKQNFTDFFSQNVACIQVTGMNDVADRTKCPMVSASLGIQCYQVELEYYPPAGTANPEQVPTIYTVLSDPHAEGDRVENAQIVNIQD